MRLFLSTLLAFFVAHASQAQPAKSPLPDSVDAFLSKSLTLLQTHSLERNTVDWGSYVRLRTSGRKARRLSAIYYPFIPLFLSN
jgi:hypothetical protein